MEKSLGINTLISPLLITIVIMLTTEFFSCFLSILVREWEEKTRWKTQVLENMLLTVFSCSRFPNCIAPQAERMAITNHNIWFITLNLTAVFEFKICWVELRPTIFIPCEGRFYSQEQNDYSIDQTIRTYIKERTLDIAQWLLQISDVSYLLWIVTPAVNSHRNTCRCMSLYVKV